MRDVGATFFNLNVLHDELTDMSVASVVEVDLYHTAALMPLNDEQVTEIALRALTNAEPSFRAAKVTESNVLRAPQCATIFSPGSYRNRPAQQTPLPNLF